MNFEEWWDREMDVIFTSSDARSDGEEAAHQAWNAAVREMMNQERKSQDNNAVEPTTSSEQLCGLCNGPKSDCICHSTKW